MVNGDIEVSSHSMSFTAIAMRYLSINVLVHIVSLPFPNSVR
jgi:hypothetical protein